MTAAKSAGRLEFCFSHLICWFFVVFSFSVVVVVARARQQRYPPNISCHQISLEKTASQLRETRDQNDLRRYPQRGSFKILNPEVQITEILGPEKPILQWVGSKGIQGFCPLKNKITQFPDGFRLNCLSFHSCHERFLLLLKNQNLEQFLRRPFESQSRRHRKVQATFPRGTFAR